MTKDTIEIYKAKMEYLKGAIKKFNRKAVKLGCDPAVLTFHDEFTKSYSVHPYTGMELLEPIHIPMIHATLEYDIPKINGYEFIAKLDIYPAEDDNVVIVSAAPDKSNEVPDEYKNRTFIQCDHCKTNRLRYHSVLLKHEDGHFIEVGSTCVKDFFGHDPKGFMLYAGLDFVKIASDYDEEEMWGNGGGRNILTYDMKKLLAHTNAIIANYGWVSKSEAYYDDLKTSTDELVWVNMNAKHREDKLADVTEEDYEYAEKTLEHFKNLDISVTNNNDYLLNCSKLVHLTYCPAKHTGIACSMVMVYRRHLQEQLERANELPSNHVGTKGERLKGIEVTVTFKKELENNYGYSNEITTLYSFQDASGNIYKTFYSGYKWNLDQGQEVVIDGTVKKHDEFKGQKQTMLNRVSVH